MIDALIGTIIAQTPKVHAATFAQLAGIRSSSSNDHHASNVQGSGPSETVSVTCWSKGTTVLAAGDISHTLPSTIVP